MHTTFFLHGPLLQEGCLSQHFLLNFIFFFFFYSFVLLKSNPRRFWPGKYSAIGLHPQPTVLTFSEESIPQPGRFDLSATCFHDILLKGSCIYVPLMIMSVTGEMNGLDKNLLDHKRQKWFSFGFFKTQLSLYISSGYRDISIHLYSEVVSPVSVSIGYLYLSLSTSFLVSRNNTTSWRSSFINLCFTTLNYVVFVHPAVTHVCKSKGIL